MPTRRPEVRLAAIAEVSSAKVDPSLYPVQAFQLFSLPSFDEGQIPSIELGSEIKSQKTVVPPTAILVSKLNPHIPRVWEPSVSIGLPAVASTEFLVLTPRQGCDRRYLKYVCMSPKVRIRMESLVTGTSGSHQRVRPEDFLNIRVDSPPTIAQQRAIARILGTLDDKIELNRQTNETLEAMARALFKSWFIDFDPVHAKAEGRDPGLAADISVLFPDSFENSELGEIPEGWSVGSVDDDFELTMGQSPPGETYNEAGNGLPFYQGRSDFGVRFPTRRVYCTAPTRFASAGDTLVSVRAPVGDVNVATERCAIGRGVAAVRHKTSGRSFTYYFMRSINEVFAQFEADGTVFGSIGKKDFHAIPCVRPPHKVVLEFERRLLGVDNRIEVNERESRTLAALRDTLLPKLLSGELGL